MATDAARKYLSFADLFTFNLPKQVIEKSLLQPLRAKRGNPGYNEIDTFEITALLDFCWGRLAENAPRNDSPGVFRQPAGATYDHSCLTPCRGAPKRTLDRGGHGSAGTTAGMRQIPDIAACYCIALQAFSIPKPQAF